MPGHAVPAQEIDAVRDDVLRLASLISEHDVIFILLDSREARWLPTLLCASEKKLAINVALGFDSYLVMRHGIQSEPNLGETSSAAPVLGCYFCNDVVAPQNSLKDRTIDQQCTVTRPGLSQIASALGVELMVSLLHHPLRALAPADTELPISSPINHPFGLVPHSIRGYLTHFANVLVVGHQYDKCTACSTRVTEQYKQYGFDFLLQAFNNPTYLEDLTGLTQMKREVDQIQWEIQEDEDFE
jgi:ubiquitin-like modifier-activating enzyme ATG7